jgi:hypothetical protein
MITWRGTVLMLLFAALAPATATAFHIRLYGLVTEHFTGDLMKGVQIRLVKDSIERETVTTTWNGKYELFLERGYEYQIWFHRKDLVTKHVLIDAREIPLFPDVPFFEMDLQMTLFEWVDGFDFTAFSEPVALAEYKHTIRNLHWNTEHTQMRHRELAKVMTQYERFVGARQKAARAASSKAEPPRKRKTVDF